MRAVIVASGPSAAGFEPPEGVTVFAVNGAVDWLPRADCWFTLDPSCANMSRMQNPRAGVKYYAAVPGGFRLPPGVTRFNRSAAVRDDSKGWFGRWGCIAKMSDDPTSINTGNSAWGALQLARHLGFTRILLVGVDGSEAPRVEGGRPNNLSHLPQLFSGVAGDIEVANAGKMQCEKIPNLTIPEGIKWLKS